MLRFFISRTVLINLSIAAGLVGGLMWYSLKSLDEYTLHGQTITVPDLTGRTVEEVDTFLSERGLRYNVRDIIYDVSKPKGTILDQDPKPESSVKENRTIYLILNASETPKLPMPDLEDETLRRAISILEVRGFEVGELEVIPDISEKVLGFKYNGKEIKAGFMVPKGSTIDLIMGGGLSMDQIQAPSIIGLSLKDAIMTLKSSSLNGAPPRWEKETIITASDTLNARVYRQNPEHGEALINLGGYVDLWLTMDYERIQIDSLATDGTVAPKIK
ncbi:MAG: PASTA domain-containing protein [Flavobacteriales bacterium]|nr:PASTA domain-containing protein [Flavobacteriales bacterium]